jgi:hypothetical protein
MDSCQAPAKLKTIDYYPVFNTHITDNKAAREYSRYSEDGAKDAGQIQGNARARWTVARRLHEHRGHANLCMLCMACFLMLKH